MRPGVHASILRNRHLNVRRVMRPHSFSMRRLVLLLIIGIVFFLPGIVLCIIALENTDPDTGVIVSAEGIPYQVIGPALATLGGLFLFCSCVYYYCYGTGESNRLPGGSHQGSINSDQTHRRPSYLGSQIGNQLHPDGSTRKSSFKDRRSPNRSPRLSGDERSPLASPEEEKKPHSPPPTILIDQASEGGNENDSQDTEILVNGNAPSGDPTIV